MADITTTLAETKLDDRYFTLLNNFIYDPESDLNNFELGLYYHNIGQTSSAVSFYIRAADRADDLLLQYESLLNVAICFITQGNRAESVHGLLSHCISILPKRPEAYFLLSREYERSGKWFDTYRISSMALGVIDNECDNLRSNFEYPGVYGILFEKAISSWWVGKEYETIPLLEDVLFNYPIDDIHKHACVNNLKRLGNWTEFFEYNENEDWKLSYPCDPDLWPIYKTKTKEEEIAWSDIVFKNKYSAADNNLKVKFNNYQRIPRNYSEAFQDIFVLYALNGKFSGYFLEIGAGLPWSGNNTALLETIFDWNGLSIDYSKACIERFIRDRKSRTLKADATSIDYSKLLSDVNAPSVIDYLQLDCEPAHVTYSILERIPFDEYKFAVITYEHDFWQDGDEYRTKSRNYLKSKGYVTVIENVAVENGKIFEDWWVHPDLVDMDKLNKIKTVGMDEVVISSIFTNSERNGDTAMGASPYNTDLGNMDNSKKKHTHIADSSPDSEYGIVTGNLFKVNSECKPSIIVYDGFYDDPDAVREFGLKQVYFPGEGAVGFRTRKQFLFDGVKEKIESILGKKITKWEEYEITGRFQYCTADTPQVYHCDSQNYAAIVYLTPDAPIEGGTEILRHKKTKKFHSSQIDWKNGEGITVFNQHTFLDKTPYEVMDKIGNVYNRLIIFDGGLIHSGAEYFGWDIESSRFFQIFFFDAA